MPNAPTPIAPVTQNLPAPLATAITNASQTYGVPADLLAGIWRIESGSHYPNNYVNASGYGGLFGTKHWNTSTQDQANTAASILATGLADYGGNVSEALSYYNTGKPTGGYTSVPGETTFGVLPRQDKWLKGAVDQSQTSGIPGAVNAGIGSVTGGVGSVVSAAEAVPKALAFIFSYRFLEILGGGLLLLLGLYLLGQQFKATFPTPKVVSAAGDSVAETVNLTDEQQQRTYEAGRRAGQRDFAPDTAFSQRGRAQGAGRRS